MKHSPFCRRMSRPLVLLKPSMKPEDQRNLSAPSAGKAESGPTPEEQERINRIIRGDQQALAELFSQYRPSLWRMVNFRLHPQLQGRIDVDDVLQESWIKAVGQMDRFLTEAAFSPFVWFRMIVSQTLVDLHRRHLGAAKRSAAREFSLQSGWNPASTSYSIAFHLLGSLTSPSRAALKEELSKQLETALQSMSDIDREVLALRHFEELSNAETAQVLQMSQQAASARYVRALTRLKEVLKALRYFEDEQRAGTGSP